MNDIVATTRYGAIRGEREAEGLVFRGVPYATAPLGALRWRRPLAPQPWAGVRDATRFGPIAPQNTDDASRLVSEDCLTLNVWTPSLSPSKRPVIVFVHGGGLYSGSGATRMTNGARLAARGDAVVVTFNYRLGILGTWYAPDELGEDSTNVALHDQAAAFRWVREHAEAFGGDPGNVTAMGQSSGAVSLACLLASPEGRGLFDKAILQSGGLENVHAAERGARYSARYFDALGAASGLDLRTLPLDRLLAAQAAAAARQVMTPPDGMFHPTIDGAVPPMHPVAAAHRGLTAPMPLLIGSTADEWRAMDAKHPDGHFDDALLAQRVRNLLGEDANPGEVIERYRDGQSRAGRATHARAIAAALVTDFHFRAPAEGFARGHSAQGHPTWHYVVEWSSANPVLDAYHGICTPLVFGTHDAVRTVGPAARAMSETIQDAWLAFARSGEPAAPNLDRWPRFDSGRRATMLLNERSTLVDGYRQEELALWTASLEGRTR